VRAMMHDDYETQGPRDSRSFIGDQFLSSAARVLHLDNAASTNLLCGICVNADLWTSKFFCKLCRELC